ncbi:MAG: DUF4912 domain-containing protein [Fibrobacter sp.]|nr:DUF4912 domain-containing protein [Fibrobacter sp.]
MKDAEEKAVKAVAKVKKAAATKVSKITDEVKKVAAKKTASKATAAKTTATKTAAAKTVATKTVATKAAAKTAVKAAAAKASAKVAKASDKEVAKLAQSFDAEYLVLMQKDPNWMHAFWEVSENRINEAKTGKGKIVLRLFDIADDLTVQRSKKRKFRDIEVPANARSWYVENTAGKSCVAVLGAVSGKNFKPIVESAPVLTFDKSAAAPAADDAFAKASLGGNTLGNFMSSGFSSQTAESWLNSLGGNFGSSSESMFSGALSSAALQSNNIEVSKDSVNYGKDFFLWVKTRLIVYGGTRPDAHLQVRGEPFPLNPDGTFSFEEDLPDSTKIIPVFATDKDGDFPTTIVPIVVKRTE